MGGVSDPADRNERAMVFMFWFRAPLSKNISRLVFLERILSGIDCGPENNARSYCFRRDDRVHVKGNLFP